MNVAYCIFFVAVFFAILLFKAKFFTKGTWNDEVLSLNQTKSILGFCAIGIVFHHLAQKTCAPWLNQEVIVHGLDFFLNLGHLFVALFFFYSGFGLFKSLKSKENYLKGFLGKHLTPIIILYLLINCEFYYVGKFFSPYTWYINAIVILYILFYCSFRFVKNDVASICLVALGILIYSFVCNWLVLGVWWYNTAFLFVVGIIFAKNEEKIILFLKSKYLLCVIFSVLIFAASFIFDILFKSELNRVFVCLIEAICAFAFVVFVLLASLKIKVQNKVLTFAGSLTLELYLIHGLFVQMFGYSFVSDDFGPVFYIKNLALYVIVVFALSFVVAFLVKLARNGCRYLIIKFNDIYSKIIKDVKKVLFGIFIVLVLVTIYAVVDKNSKAQKLQDDLDTYAKQNVQFVEVDQKQMSVYVKQPKNEDLDLKAEPETIVFFAELIDPCPTMSLKNLADTMAQKYNVVVIDYFGTGFSESTDKKRSAQNLSEEIHSALEQLEVCKNKYSIFTVKTSAILGQYYSSKYSNELNKVIGIDGMVESTIMENLEKNRINEQEYQAKVNSSCKINYYFCRVLEVLGFKKFTWPLFDDFYSNFMTEEERVLISELFSRNFRNKEITDALINQVETLNFCQSYKYPESLQVVDFVSDYRTRSDFESYNFKLENYYREKCKNQNNHKVHFTVGGIYARMKNPQVFVDLL